MIKSLHTFFLHTKNVQWSHFNTFVKQNIFIGLAVLQIVLILHFFQWDLERGASWPKYHEADQLITNWHCCHYPTLQQLLHYLHLCSNFGEHLSSGLFSGATTGPHHDHRIQENASENVEFCAKGTNVCPQHHEDRFVRYKCSRNMPIFTFDAVCVVNFCTLFSRSYHEPIH